MKRQLDTGSQCGCETPTGERHRCAQTDISMRQTEEVKERSSFILGSSEERSGREKHHAWSKKIKVDLPEVSDCRRGVLTGQRSIIKEKIDQKVRWCKP